MMKTLLSVGIGLIVVLSLLESVNSAPVIAPRQKGKAISFLAKFGYLAETNSTDSAGGRDVNSPEVRKAIEDLQRFGNLPVTGKLDAKTLELVSKKRCGLEDPVKKLNSGNVIGQFYLQGTYWKKKDLTYRFKELTEDLDAEEQKNVIRRMIHKWDEASSLTITEETDSSVSDDDVDILIRFVRGRHYDPYPFDGPGGTLAHAYYPHNNKGFSGDAHFDDDEKFTTGTPDGINLDWVALHEFGHSLGLEHSNVRESIMYPWYKGYFENIELTNDDLKGIRALYGAEKPMTKKTTPSIITEPNTPPISDSTTTPTPAPTPTPPPTFEPGVHPACRPASKYDAVVADGSWSTHFIQGDWFWSLSPRLIKGEPKRVKDYWPHVITPVNAAYRNKKGNLVFFSGSRFWEYSKVRQLERWFLVKRGLTQNLGLPSSLDAVFIWSKNKKIYFFKGTQYWRYNDRTQRPDRGYPRDIKAGWPDLPNNVDAVVTWRNDRSYVFNGPNYYRLQNYPLNRKVYVDPQYRDNKKFTSQGWMKCSVGAIGAIGAIKQSP